LIKLDIGQLYYTIKTYQNLTFMLKDDEVIPAFIKQITYFTL